MDPVITATVKVMAVPSKIVAEFSDGHEVEIDPLVSLEAYGVDLDPENPAVIRGLDVAVKMFNQEARWIREGQVIKTNKEIAVHMAENLWNAVVQRCLAQGTLTRG